jgi:hypothetical protein
MKKAFGLACYRIVSEAVGLNRQTLKVACP